jgi:exodeoxyribonuclease V beta subunit
MTKPLNSVYDIEWKPRVLIEASAGTGKTYTIAGLFVRLLVEKKLTVDRILVMTFTRKATAELRDRIFRRLRECLRMLEDNNAQPKDLFMQLFLKTVTDREEVLQMVKTAIRNFDDSQVTTIHGFCQKVLKEEALTAGTPFEVEVALHDDLLSQATEDYWRQFIDLHSQSEAGRYYVAKLLSMAPTPAKLQELIHPLINKWYAKVNGKVLDNPLGYLDLVLQLRNEMKRVWEDDEPQILEILNACDISRFQQYLEIRLKKLRSFLFDENYATDSAASLVYFTSGYLYDHNNLKKSGNPKPTVQHPFFELCQEYSDLIIDIENVKTTLIVKSSEEISERRKNLLIHSTAVTYDDLLKNVQRTLTDPETGVRLSEALKRKYPFALVDEFQDTDPVQYEIFDNIYPEEGDESGLFMIGDPKQAIYRFRGADIYTYFKARKAVRGEVYTLENNYRSSPRLVKAVNAVFSGERNAFIEPEIDFFNSRSGNPEGENVFVIDGKPADHFWITAKAGMEKSKDPCRAFTFQQTVTEITNLLHMAGQGRVTIDGRKLMAGDVAVLVSGHSDAGVIKKMLKFNGIDSVTYSRQQVFETFEAHRMALLMAAVLEPFNRGTLNNFLVSGFLGLDLLTLYEKADDEVNRDVLSAELQILNGIWHKHGFYPMFRSLLFCEDRLMQLARLSNSERVLTNLFQLAEICTKAENKGGLDPRALYTWFLREKMEPGSDEEQTLLLESDQHLVKISTIHNSKGLQFPVVFCPTLWESKNNTGALIEFHPEGSDRLVIHAGQQADSELTAAKGKNKQESVAEEVRKAYVAVTRAKYFCHVLWASHRDSSYSGFGAQAIGEKLFKEPKDVFSFEDVFENLAKSHPDTIQFKLLDEPNKRTFPVSKGKAESEEIVIKSYKGRKELTVQRKLESFSSLMRPYSRDSYQPDYDQVMEAYISAFDRGERPGRDLTIFNFPRGAAAGTAIHKLFERDELDFTTATTAEHSAWIGEVLSQHQIDSKWIPVIRQMLTDVTGATLPGIELSEVKNSERLREMEFHFLSADTESERLFRIIRKPSGAKPGSVKTSGFMTGFIDLIICHNSRYYILDYKSNYLGDDLTDYDITHLQHEILTNGYDLQYHLYTLALIQYLQKRIPEFNYETHFGGAAYLFVRGMRAGSSNGVWFHKPGHSVMTVNWQKNWG